MLLDLTGDERNMVTYALNHVTLPPASDKDPGPYTEEADENRFFELADRLADGEGASSAHVTQLAFFPGGDTAFVHDGVHVERRYYDNGGGPFPHPNGEWAVVKTGKRVLNRAGEWEFEPMPSARDEAFYKRCRFTLAEAIQLAREEAERALRELERRGVTTTVRD